MRFIEKIINRKNCKTSIDVCESLNGCAEEILSNLCYRYVQPEGFQRKGESFGTWYTPNIYLAGSYCNFHVSDIGKLYQVNIHLKNPLVVDCQGGKYIRLSPENCKFSSDIKDFKDWLYGTDGIAHAAKLNHFDGVIFINVKENDRKDLNTSICVFDENLLKNKKEITSELRKRKKEFEENKNKFRE